MASVSSCSRWRPGWPWPRQPDRQGRPGVVVRVLRQPLEACGARRKDRVDLGVLGLHRLQRRPPCVVGALEQQGPEPRVLARCGGGAAPRRRPPSAAASAARSSGPRRASLRRPSANAARSRRNAWCITYIIVMSTGPAWAAVWPGTGAARARRSWRSGRRVMVVPSDGADGLALVVVGGAGMVRRGCRRVVVGLGADGGRDPVEPSGHPPVAVAETTWWPGRGPSGSRSRRGGSRPPCRRRASSRRCRPRWRSPGRRRP